MKRGRGGTADALASGASGGNLVVVQIHSTAPYEDKASGIFPGGFFVLSTKIVHILTPLSASRPGEFMRLMVYR